MNPPQLATKRRIKRIEPLQLGKIFAVLYGALGLLFIPIFLVAGIATSQIPEAQRGGLLIMSAGFGLFAPVVYAVMGFVFGVVGAFIYNLVAKWIGGIEVEVE